MGMPSNDICMPLKRDKWYNCLALDLSSLSFAHVFDENNRCCHIFIQDWLKTFGKYVMAHYSFGNETDDLIVRHFLCTEYCRAFVINSTWVVKASVLIWSVLVDHVEMVKNVELDLLPLYSILVTVWVVLGVDLDLPKQWVFGYNFQPKYSPTLSTQRCIFLPEDLLFELEEN